ncbi:MAG: thymidylate kinase [Candidatus Fournierella pullistercoris]|uniref:Thymidylate kinase n=1 Tax=Candidatus Allofournierella pullistercoris TaxID=2838597 RepID=A0A948WRJ7_9FIRM|nr:thymidylate kinase [Candidatus Fournierella pullistercoris]
MQGKLIAIEGLDGSGKATQSLGLCQELQALGYKVRRITFPDYDSPASAPVKLYLAGKYGEKPGDVSAYAASSFYAVDRFSSYKTNWGQFYREGGIIIADRYTTSNAIHQCAKLPREQWEDYLRWLFDFEYSKLGIPEPDGVIYLKVDPLVSQKLMSGRYGNDESKKDIHERDLVYMHHSQQAANYCAETLGWKQVECCHQGEMRSIAEIKIDVMRATKEILC